MATSSAAKGGRAAAAALRAAAPAVLALALVLLSLWLYVDAHALAFVLAFVAASAALLAFSAATVSPETRRIEDAEAAADALAAGRFGARMEVRDDEFATLAAALNSAAARIQAHVTSLDEQRQQLESLLNAGADASIAVAADGTIVYMNDGARAMFGPAASAGRPFIEVVRDHDLNDVVIAAAARGERSVRVVPYGAAQRWLQATAVPIEGAGAWAALAVFHDLTEVRRLDSMRRDFITNVSHELRTPLAGIRAATETLQEGALDEPRAAREFLGHIQHETDRLSQMVEELLELSRIESGAAPMSFAEVDARALVRGAVGRFAQQASRAGLALHADLPDAPLLVYGDAERLERALGNLIANAIRFTPSGGAVTAGVAPADDGTIAISVEDTGVGISPGERGRVFERFYKADRGRGDGGVGLGLAIVKHTVLAHAGSVGVESRPGRGARFTMRLPRR
ncbi:MAG: HAMP domain-containing protein [Dehalococcoidia bacterium]|nr:HAMP domain-containing protein [Dehalococcoidia bacterium]